MQSLMHAAGAGDVTDACRWSEMASLWRSRWRSCRGCALQRLQSCTKQSRVSSLWQVHTTRVRHYYRNFSLSRLRSKPLRGRRSRSRAAMAESQLSRQAAPSFSLPRARICACSGHHNSSAHVMLRTWGVVCGRPMRTWWRAQAGSFYSQQLQKDGEEGAACRHRLLCVYVFEYLTIQTI